MRGADPAIGEAPGRLDFLGGVADYSGALVLQTPTKATTRVKLQSCAEEVVECRAPGSPAHLAPLAPLCQALGSGADWPRFRVLLRELGAPHWAHYVLGCLLVFAKVKAWLPSGGLVFHVASDVPQALGVSSSAALEIATLRALANFTGVAFSANEIAHLGQCAENHIVGAPCGLMDQLASAFGQHGKLLPILCRPDFWREPVSLPPGVCVVGWPSGVKHAVSGSPYAVARAASFMGKRIAERLLGRRFAFTSEIPLADLHATMQSALLERMRGDTFLREYGGVDDALSEVQSDREYPVLAATSFAIEENARSERALVLFDRLASGKRSDALSELGGLLYQSHHAYGRMGLGSPDTDRMVAAAHRLGSAHGIYGARISGGGSGGTVVLLVEESALPELGGLGETVGGSPAAWIY